MDSDSDMEPDDDDFMPESDESSDETVSVVLNNERTPSTSAGIRGRRGGRGRNRGKGASRGKGGGVSLCIVTLLMMTTRTTVTGLPVKNVK